MRTVTWLSVTGLILLAAGCDSNSALAGKWLGSVTEKGKSTKVALDLRPQGETIAGTFTILEGEAASGAPIAILNAHRSDGKLEFVVPISGQIDADAVFFELLLKRGRLEGYGREMRQGSHDLPAVFEKQRFDEAHRKK